MLRPVIARFCLAVCLCSGCATVNVAALRSMDGMPEDTFVIPTSRDPRVRQAEDAEFTIQMAAYNQENSKQLLMRMRPGALIMVVDEANRQYQGTLESIGRDDFELRDCICKEAIPDPRGQLQAKVSHVPSELLSMAAITHVRLIAEPETGRTAKDAAKESCDHCVVGIMYHSGKRQRWGRPLERATVDAGPETEESR